MTQPCPIPAQLRPQTRHLLGRLEPLRSRVLPPLDAIARSVEAIRERWPEAATCPPPPEREALVLDMAARVAQWRWSDITIQQVISAAVAVFDEARRRRPDLEPLRAFYLAEIASGAPGAFLDGMASVYIESFEPGAEHTLLLATALGSRRHDLGGRQRQVCDALPALFQPEAAPQALARIMLDAGNAYTTLKGMGLTAPHTSGLAKAACGPFVAGLAPDLAQAEAREKLFNWFAPQKVQPMETGAGPAVEALLAIWRDRTPPDALRNDLSEAIIAAWGDPRLKSGGIWPGFDPDLRAVLLRWLTHQDMKFFCDVVTDTQDSHMWAPRRDFWLKLYHDRMIDEAWVAFGTDALRHAEKNLSRSSDPAHRPRFGQQKDRGGSTSLLIMRIGRKIVVDGCHSYKTHIFRADDRNAPKLYQETYSCDEIMRVSSRSKPHGSIRNWSDWVLQNV